MKKGVILAVVTGAPADEDVLDVTFELSRIYDSHIEVLHPRLDPYLVLAGIIDGINGLGTSDIIVGIKQDIDRRQMAAQRAFADWSDRHAVRTEFDAGKNITSSNGQPTASWRQHDGTYESAMMQYGRLVDLIVVAQPTVGGSRTQDTIVESALFDTGRPVLCVPRGMKKLDARRVAIMWNGSLQAARAVGDAMPLLAACGSAVVVTAGLSDGPDATELVERLVMRGIDARTRRIPGPSESTPTALLAALADAQCGLVVMGGYGHSKLREMLLGGVTRHMLTEAKVPMLLAH